MFTIVHLICDNANLLVSSFLYYKNYFTVGILAAFVKLKFHGTDTPEDPRAEVGVSGDFPVQLATSRTRTTILADLSADLTDTRAFPREDPREVVR